MKIIRVPLRITLGGGGTDLPAWYKDHGGYFISAAINKYIYITGTERPFDKKIWLSYSSTEICGSVIEIKHDLIKSVLKKFPVSNGIELHSISEVPGQSGLGSSGSFLVGLLYLVGLMNKVETTRSELAEIACSIEIDELGKKSGKQDQYIAAYGGLNEFELDKSGNVKVRRMELDPVILTRLQNNLLIYFSGYNRDADSILSEQSRNISSKNIEPAMIRIQEIGYESGEAIKSGDLEKFGKLMDEHWEVKKTMTGSMSNGSIDRIYLKAKEWGALGGKIMGAGGGGFFLFYVPENDHRNFRMNMSLEGYNELNWRFDFDGCIPIYSV